MITECKKDYYLEYAYDLKDSIQEKVEKICTKIYGAKSVVYTKEATEDLKTIAKLGVDNLPVIIAKTQYSLSDNKDLIGAPKDFDITVRNLEIRTGAGFVVVCLGKMLLMPGLNKTPAYEKMKIDSKGTIDGIF